MTTTSPATEHAAARAFNDYHPLGTPVRYWKGAREGDGKVARTRTEAQLLSGHTAVIWLEGVSGCIALTHIQPITEEELASAERIPAPRPVPTLAERLGDSRLCGHTPDQHRHDDGQAADARSQDRRIRELEAELARERARADRTDDALLDARYTIDQVLSDKNTALARANHVATELGHALDLIAEVRNNRERDDRALAAYDTRPSKPAASVTITLDNSKGTFTPRHPGDALADALRNAYDTEQLATLHERTVDQLDDDAPREDPLGRLVDALFAARWHQQPPSSVPPRRAQEDPTAEALAEHLTAYQWYSKPEFPLLHEPSAHREHIYNSDCAICRGDWVRVAGVALAFVLAERKG